MVGVPKVDSSLPNVPDGGSTTEKSVIIDDEQDEDDDLVMRKRDTTKPREASTKVEEKNNPDHEAIVADLIHNPQKLKDMMNQMNMDTGVMRDAMRDITSNPEAMRGARELMGVSTNEQLRDKMMQKMTKNGKQPKRRDVMRQQKEMKKILRNRGDVAVTPSDLPLALIYIDASKKLKQVSVIPKTQLPSDGSQPDMKIIGHLRVFYNAMSKKQNRLAKRILGEALGEPITLQHIDGETHLLPCETSLIQLARTPYNPRLFDGTVDEDKLNTLITEYCANEVCSLHEEDGCSSHDIEIKSVHEKKETPDIDFKEPNNKENNGPC